MKLPAAALAFVTLAANILAAAPVQRDDGFIPTHFLNEGAPRAQVLLLGTFHFQDAGLDGYKPKHPVDILSAGRQAELADVLQRLAAFRPTQVCIEGDDEFQPKADERYAQYLTGKFSLQDRPNEIYQVGFRLGQLAGVKRLHCVDAASRGFPGMPDTEEQVRAYAQTRGEVALLDDGWQERFTALYAHDDELKTQLPLRNFLLYLNSAERLRMGHGHYLTGMFKVGVGDNYWGADDLAGNWYDRNLRIFARILRLASDPRERIVVIIGAGHVPILRHLVQSSPELQLVEVRDVLGAP